MLRSRDAVPVEVVEHPMPDGFAVGDLVRVHTLHGTFVVTGAGRDGSLSLYGGTSQRRSHRSIMPDRCRKVTR